MGSVLAAMRTETREKANQDASREKQNAPTRKVESRWDTEGTLRLSQVQGRPIISHKHS